MNRKLLYPAITAIFSFFLVFVSGYADTPKKEDNPIPRTVLKDGEVNIYAWFFQLRPGKLAVITRVPKKFQISIQEINLKSPSGLTYKTKSPRNMPLRDLKKYLTTASRRKSHFKLALYYWIKSLFINDAYASGEHCEGAAGERINLGPLINLIDKSPWVSVGLFDVNEEFGNWEIGVKYTEEGKMGRAGGSVVYAGNQGSSGSTIDFENLIGGPLIPR